MNTKTIEWLLQGEPWVEYRTRVELLGQPESDPQVRAARKATLADSKIKSLLSELADWPGTVLNSHRSASQPFHKLSFLADLGLNVSDPSVKKIVQKVMKHQSQQGPFQLPTNVPVHFGGSGKDEWAWALCDAPVIVSSLIQLGMQDDLRVQIAVEYLEALVRENGWPCAVSPELGKFRGPGRKEDPCPYATLVMLKVMAHVQKSKSANEQITKSANQQIAKSANQQIAKSANQQISKSPNQQISKSPNQQRSAWRRCFRSGRKAKNSIRICSSWARTSAS
jgi:hypothetical protein